MALYEGWFLPFAVILPVSFALLGGLIALWLRGMPLDVYGQVGLVLLIGLAAKNAILIVEFSKDRLEEGDGTIEAAAEDGARTRYRPSDDDGLGRSSSGSCPLVIATGCGRGLPDSSIGTTVFGGMILATFVGVLFIPPLFVISEAHHRASVGEGAEPGGRRRWTPTSW